jgi:lipopolysaccharide heptosyltransferase II
MKSHEFKRILAVKTHGLGDILMTTPALRALRKRFPQASITFMASRSCAEVLSNNPNIDAILEASDKTFFQPSLTSLCRLTVDLIRRRFDAAILFSKSPALHFMMVTTCIPVRIGFIKNQFSKYLLTDGVHLPGNPDYRKTTYEAEDNLALVKLVDAGSDGTLQLDFFPTRKDYQLIKAFINQERKRPGNPLVGICPGGGQNPSGIFKKKLWPAANFAKLADALIEAYGMEVVLAGGPDDGDSVKLVRSHMAYPAIDACGRFTLHQTGALYKKCALIITNDSIPVHIATALQVPVVVLFGPSNPFAVTSDNGRMLRIKSPLSCSPCFWQATPNFQTLLGGSHFPTCPRSDNQSSCMEVLKVDQVWENIQAFIDKL